MEEEEEVLEDVITVSPVGTVEEAEGMVEEEVEGEVVTEVVGDTITVVPVTGGTEERITIYEELMLHV